MEKYRPPFTITDEIVRYVSSISEKAGRITEFGNLKSRPHLRKNNRIKSVYSSLRIEANSLTLGQVKDVIDGKTVLGEKKEIQEVKNAFAAYEKLTETDPYSIEDLKALHGIMTKYLMEESGEFRRGEEGVFDGDKCIFMAPPAGLVPELMENLFTWMKEAAETTHPLILSSVFHYEFVFIHPFSDGNGRMARLWQNAILYNWKPVFAYIPIESNIEKFQGEYYEAIESCHRNGESTAFIEFMLRQIDSIMDEVDVEAAGNPGRVSEYVKKLLKAMEDDRAYSAEELMKKLKLRSRENFRSNYLKPAQDFNVITMTIPDKPRSRNQRYVKTDRQH